MSVVSTRLMFSACLAACSFGSLLGTFGSTVLKICMLPFESFCIFCNFALVDKQGFNHMAHQFMSLLMYDVTLMPALNWMFVMGVILSLHASCAPTRMHMSPPK